MSSHIHIGLILYSLCCSSKRQALSMEGGGAIFDLDAAPKSVYRLETNLRNTYGIHPIRGQISLRSD